MAAIDIDRVLGDGVIARTRTIAAGAGPRHDLATAFHDDRGIATQTFVEEALDVQRGPWLRFECGDAIFDALVVDAGDCFGVRTASGSRHGCGLTGHDPAVASSSRWIRALIASRTRRYTFSCCSSDPSASLGSGKLQCRRSLAPKNTGQATSSLSCG